MSKNITTIEKSAIEYLCGLIRELSNVSEGIDDINLRSNGTFSSVKIDTLLNNLETDCNEYTDRLVANLSRLELKIVTNEADINKSNILYLHKPDGATSYNQYVVIEGNKVLLGTTDISMTDYYTITQADAKFCSLTDYNSLKTAHETHKNDTDIHTSAIEKASYVKKTDITTTIGSTSTDSQVPSAKVVYDNIINKNTIQPTGTIANYSSVFDWAINNIGATCGYEGNMFDDCPLNHTWGILVCIGTKVESGLKVLFCTNYNKDIYTRTIQRRKGVNGWVETSWQRLCNTSVDDVGLTHIENKIDTTYGTIHNMWYEVKNGECFVQVDILKMVINTNGETLFPAGTLPKPANNRYFCVTSYINSKSALLQVTTDGTIKCWSQADLVGYAIHDSFSYPVSES